MTATCFKHRHNTRAVNTAMQTVPQRNNATSANKVAQQNNEKVDRKTTTRKIKIKL